MRKTSLLFAFIMLCSIILPAQESNDDAQIRKVIESAYIDGIHNLGSVDDINRGFHPGFDLLILRNNSLSKLPIYTWVESVIQRKAEQPEGQERKISVKFLFNDITGNAAVSKIELYREDKLLFTDYLSLYKFHEGWRIVSKIYQQH
ncbi:putative lumazine-binding protein [anaerobic digester metagenome]